MWYIIIVVIAITTWGLEARAHDWQHDQYAQDNRPWLEKQRRPGTQLSCCSSADYDFVDEELRSDGHYWIQSAKTGSKWIQVPHEAVINDPNHHGRAAAWFRWEGANGDYSTAPRPDLKVTVFCFAPGAKT